MRPKPNKASRENRSGDVVTYSRNESPSSFFFCRRIFKKVDKCIFETRTVQFKIRPFLFFLKFSFSKKKSIMAGTSTVWGQVER